MTSGNPSDKRGGIDLSPSFFCPPTVTKPYKFIGFGAMDVTKPSEFIRFGALLKKSAPIPELEACR